MGLMPPSGPLNPEPKSGRLSGSRSLRRSVALPLLLALILGMQLGALPWRYRRQIALMQGFALGALVGYLVGRLQRSAPSRG